MEHKENVPEILGPRYAVRVGDLRDWHVLRVRCERCKHEGSIYPARLRARAHESARLVDLAARFRCQHCKASGQVSWAVFRSAGTS